MYFAFKYQLICLFFLFFLFFNNYSVIRNITIMENIWVSFFCFLCYLDLHIDDVLFLNLSLFCLVLASCELVTLISLYILDYNK